VIQALDARPTRMVVMPRFDPAVFVAAVAEHRPTNVMLAPAMALALVNSPAAARLSAASVQIVRTSSAPIAPATLRRLAALFKRAKVVNVLSSTESWPGRATMVYDPLRPDSLGRSEQGGTLRVVGDDGAVLPPDEVGHLELRQPGAPQRRYLDDPEATASVFRAEGWVRTGDLARLDTDGYVHMVDRETDRINSGGVKVSSIEVEATLLEHPGVVDAAVIGLPHPSLGEYVAAVLRVTPDFDRTALNAFLAQELGDDRAPKRIVVVDELPRNALGKVLKRRLRDELTARDAADAGAAAAEERDELHETVRSIWGTALDREDRIAWDMPFLAGGGDSLSANAIAAAVRRRLGREVSVRDVFEAETLSRFADRVKRAEPARKAPADRIERVAREEA
jgi:acyl-CoA synthetase (AMP-forming)/AMP-acid ligase II